MFQGSGIWIIAQILDWSIFLKTSMTDNKPNPFSRGPLCLVWLRVLVRLLGVLYGAHSLSP
jgi:hypothetical protein